MPSYIPFDPPASTAVAHHRRVALRLAAGATLYRLPAVPPATVGEVVADDAGTPLPSPVPPAWALLAAPA